MLVAQKFRKLSQNFVVSSRLHFFSLLIQTPAMGTAPSQLPEAGMAPPPMAGIRQQWAPGRSRASTSTLATRVCMPLSKLQLSSSSHPVSQRLFAVDYRRIEELFNISHFKYICIVMKYSNLYLCYISCAISHKL